jgi:hypothetical protein
MTILDRSALATTVSVTSSFLLGLILVRVPWTSLWENNYLLQSHPLFRSIMLSAFTRGAVTGLGLVNLLLGAREASAHFRGTHGRV